MKQSADPGEIVPEKVQQVWMGIESQGFKVLSVTRRECDESDEKVSGLLGWVILVDAKEVGREPWRVWVFDHDPLSEVEANAERHEVFAVGVEIV